MKTPFDVILVKLWQKNAQTSDSDFGKPQNYETFCNLGIFKFSGRICDEVWLKVNLIWNKNAFVEKIYHKKTEKEVIKISSAYSK